MTTAVPARLRFDQPEPQVEWLTTDGSPFTEPFFEWTLRRLARLPENTRARRSCTPAASLRDRSGGIAPTAFVFHTSRCGSTLMMQMLSELRRNIVIAEAPVLDDILLAHRRDPRITDDRRIDWLHGAVHALGTPKSAGEDRFFVKLDSWHIFELPVVRRAFPGVPFFFVYRDPLEVLVSLMQRPSMTLIRGTVTPEQLGLTTEQRDALPLEDHAAAVIGAFFQEARKHRMELQPIAYEQLPRFVWEQFPGGPFSEEERLRLESVAARSAKEPTQPFTPDSATKHQEATAATAAACARWAEPPYRHWLDSVRAEIPA